MTAVVLGGMLVKHSTPCFKSFEKTTWLVLASEPSDVLVALKDPFVDPDQ